MEKRMKERLDVLLVNRGLAESREKAKAVIMTGNVFVNDQREDKAGQKFPEEVCIEIRGKKLKFVSRGGYKLDKAVAVFPIELKDQVCMDVGASTGGFTDCMLQNGAAFVYAVDVGTNQLAWKLRQDERVRSMEKTNIRYVVCLIKPQFEAGREKVGKKGVVRDPAVHRDVIESIISYAGSLGFTICGLDFSPIRGPEGNIEYLLYIKKDNQEFGGISQEQKEEIRQIVEDAQEHAVKHAGDLDV